MFSSRFVEPDKNDQVMDKTEIYFEKKNMRNLTPSVIDNIEVRSLNNSFRIKGQKKVVGDSIEVNQWQIVSKKTKELSGSSYVKFPLNPSALLNIVVDDKSSFLRSNLVRLHLSKTNHPNRVSNYRQ